MPGVLWLTMGFFLGIFATLLMGLAPNFVDVRSVASSGAGKSGEEQNIKYHPEYGFYDTLQETEVTIPDLELVPTRKSRKAGGDTEDAVQKQPRPSSSAVAVSEARQYLLQAGSFRNEKDADRLRGQLILQGLAPKIELVTVGGGESWHRVQLGPFSDQETLNKNRSVLMRNNIDSLLLLLK